MKQEIMSRNIMLKPGDKSDHFVLSAFSKNSTKSGQITINFSPVEIVVPDVAINATAIIYNDDATDVEDALTDQGSSPPNQANEANKGNDEDVLNRQYKKAVELKVARFRNSLSRLGTVNLSREDDAFLVRITGSQYKNKVGTVTLQAFDEKGEPEGKPNNVAQTVALRWSATPEPGLYSVPMILVSDDADRNGLRCTDTFGNAGSHPELAFKISGNGTLRIQSFKINDEQSVTVSGHSVPAAKITNNVPITIHVLETADDPNRTEVFKRVNEHVKTANERFLQVGVRIQPDIQPVLHIPESLKKQKIEINPDTHEKRNCVYWNKKLPAERPADELLLANLAPKSKASDIVVFYADVAVAGETRNIVNGQTVGSYTYGMIRGAAWCPVVGNNAISPENRMLYENRIIMSFKDAQIFTLAHEIGHILTRNLHYGADYGDKEDIDVRENNILEKGNENDFRVWMNLMTPTSPFNTITSTKRLYHKQEDDIRTYLLTVPY